MLGENESSKPLTKLYYDSVLLAVKPEHLENTTNILVNIV